MVTGVTKTGTIRAVHQDQCVHVNLSVCVDKFYKRSEDILSGPHCGTNPPKTVRGLMLELDTGGEHV